MNRTLQANDLIKGSAYHQSRKQNENLHRTKRMLEPNLQEEIDVLGNKITGCAKKEVPTTNDHHKFPKNKKPSNLRIGI